MAAPGIRFTVSLKYGGRRIRRKMDRLIRNVHKAAAAAANREGARARREVRGELAALLAVPAAAVRATERARAATLRRPVYSVRWKRPGLPVAKIKGARFKAYRGQKGTVRTGRLSFPSYGKPVRFSGVTQEGRGRAARYRFAGGRPVYGVSLKGGYRPVAALRPKIRARFRARFRRELRARLRRGR